jgi:uncharacterized oligopeptide transporter (OPT) family protein
MLAIGAGIAFAMLALNVSLERSRSRYRAHVMPVAVGIYLPFSLSVPILTGGIIAHALAKRGEAATNRSVLIASGLIAGEAIAGIVIAAVVVGLQRGGSAQQLPVPMLDSDLLSVALFAAVGLWVYLSGKKAAA